MAERASLVRDLAHVVVLFVLLLVLLVVVTKFKIVHPSTVPGWQGVYCDYVEQKHSIVGFVIGSDGAGDPDNLMLTLSKSQPTLRIEPVRLSDITPGLLSRYEVLVVEKSKTVPFRTLSALESYLDGGGTLIWASDSLSHQVLDSRDLSELKQENLTHPDWYARTGKDYYTWFIEEFQSKPGFGDFGDKFIGGFIEARRSTGSTFLNPVMRDHLMLSGITRVKLEPQIVLGVVNQNDDVNMLASIEGTGDDAFPAILEKKYVGRILYFAFPLESLESTAFLDNVFDYLVTC
ncbi:MAG: hypothetical protein V1644_03225 [Candidatus Micrarchaeota archaeon]